MMIENIPQLAVAAIAGVTAHATYFVHGEHHLTAARTVGYHLNALMIIAGEKYLLESFSPRGAILQALGLASIYCGALFTSILIYRQFLSPLRHIPGPLSFRLTKLAHFFKQYWYTTFEIQQDFHQKYGDVVRTGPDEVMLFGADAYRQVYGTRSRCGRPPQYDLVHPLVSLGTTRSPAEHTAKRKVWQQAFASQRMDQLESCIYGKADLLIRQFRKQGGKPFNVRDWLECYTFDLVGEFGLGHCFNTLDTGKPGSVLSLSNDVFGPLGIMPWLAHLLLGLKPLMKIFGYGEAFKGWAVTGAMKSIDESNESRFDLINYVIQDAKKNGGIEANRAHLMGDFLLLTLAGSESMKGAIPGILYHLIKDSERLDKLMLELNTVDIRDYKQLKELPFLSACIYETLRVYPTVPSQAYRMSPSGGIVVNDTFIPEGTTIGVPQYSLMRDPRNFVQPTEWIPERFCTRPELILDKGAFVPWTSGPYSCLGKHISLLELRVAVALILTNFDVEFAPGEDGRRLFGEMTDYFTAGFGPFRLVMKERSAK